MNKFQKLISDNSNEVLKRRAGNIATTAQIAQQSLVNDLKVKIAKLENDLMNLTDLSPQTTDSLKPGTDNWDPQQWSKSLQTVKEQLYNNRIKLQLAEETYNEFFTDEAGDSK
jgi:hypothetical protein